ncbi:hypothetical protein OHD62_35145 [Mesorhizobium sp. YC-39]|uniref:hypothetical protein n=1 Tax=unclassified Mesorhizobium TaxID=325217 RepID=UPI0021E7FB25|nr:MULTISPECIES: hypothetical protein [unclassified Mesorhizobium]MCV3211849.1 hypothetical protein [Mesorhizobium sp. YC-2]MCV3233572.1 hypothetical protein [Mesorhizobium sp. YC-39]
MNNALSDGSIRPAPLSSRDFASIEDYRRCGDQEAAKQNRRRAKLVDDERRALKPLPSKRTTDFNLVSADVTRNSAISIDRVAFRTLAPLLAGKLSAIFCVSV